MKLDEMKKLYIKANKVYNNDPNGKLVMTDSEFDALEKKIKKADPGWEGLRATGAVVNKKTAVNLTHFMPSLTKVYPEDLPKWRAKQKTKQWLMMQKLDGSALQAVYHKGKCRGLMTRGDGTIGKDISFLIPHLNLPTIKEQGIVVLRIEAVVKKAAWLKRWRADFDNARQMANGLLNRRNAHVAMKDISMVVLGVYNRPLLAGLQWASKQGFDTVACEVVSIDADFEDLLSVMRENAEYDIDGAVLSSPDVIFQYESADRPKWTAAFKVNDDASAVEAKVVDIIWQLSRNNRWTPKIQIEPTKMKGVVVTYATAHNAQWMKDRRIGVGAVVKVVRSGDVIPKIVGVVKKAPQPSHPPGDFYEEGVHYFAIGQQKEAQVREMHHFFSTLGIENLASKGIAKLYDAGLTSVLHYIEAMGKDKPFKRTETAKGFKAETLSTFGVAQLADAGLGWVTAAKVMTDMQRVLREDGVTLLKLMVASNCFESFGERKLLLVENFYRGIRISENPLGALVKKSDTWLASEVNRASVAVIKGMGTASANQLFDGLIRFRAWLRPIYNTKLIKINPPAPVQKGKKIVGILTGEFVSFTSYRDESHKESVEAMGGTIIPYGAKTTVLLYKAGGKSSSKIDKARDKGITVTTFEELK